MSTARAPGTPVLLALTLLVAIFMIGPILVSVSAGLMQNYSTGWRSGFTLRWLTEVRENDGSPAVP